MMHKYKILLFLLSIQCLTGFGQTLKCPKNIDFELGNFTGWKMYTGSCCPIVTNTSGTVSGRHTLTSGTGTDPYGKFPVIPTGGGSYALKLGNSSTGSQAEKARYYIRVPAGVSNYSLIYRYAVVFQDPDHKDWEQPRFEVKAYDSITNNGISCANFSYIASSSLPGFKKSSSGTDVYYKEWSTAIIDLSGYGGRTVIIDFATGDCDQGAHFGYGYVDMSCGLFQISSVICKGQTTSVLAAPPGFKTYDWRDSTMNVSIGTTASITVNTPKKKTKYYVILQPYDGFGCPDTLTTVIDVTQVKSTFTVKDSSQCQRGNKFEFTNSSEVSKGELSYAWSFGDNTSSSDKSPLKSYTNAGTYTIKLIAKSDDGCADTATVRQVIVHNQPKAFFTVNDSTQCLRDNNFVFTNKSSLSVGTLSFNWHFGNGDSSSLNSPAYQYNTFNKNVSRLIVKSDKNCRDTFMKPVEIYAQPKSYFTLNDSTQCMRNNSFIFSNLSEIGSGSLSYMWDYGNGNGSSASDPFYNYPAYGFYSTRLIASSADNCHDTFYKPIEVYPQPKSDFTVNNATQCLKGNLFVFTNKSTIAAGVKTYQWTFGNRETDTVDHPVVTYKTYNLYKVKLLVSSAYNCLDSVEKKVTIYEQPGAHFTVPDSTQCLRNNLFVFTNKTSLISGSYSSKWDLGDGSYSTKTSESHRYNTYKTYTVKLAVNTTNNCTDTFYKNIVVYAQPLVSFAVNDSMQCLRQNTFRFISQGWIDSGKLNYNWSFGDGINSIEKDPEHSFSAHQNNTVRLIASSNSDCHDTAYQSVKVYAQPHASFSVSDTAMCLRGNRFELKDESSIADGSFKHHWDFGNGDFSNVAEPVYSYNAGNAYMLRLVVSSNNNCHDTMEKKLEVYPQPAAAFSVNDSTQCMSGHSFSFKNSSRIASGNLTYYWQSGDARNFSVPDPVWSYAQHGNYLVSLISSSGFNCRDTMYKPVEVYPQASPGFYADTVCLNQPTTLVSTSTLPAGNFASFEWALGDNNTGTGNIFTHVYAQPGTYSIRLKTTSDHGCVDSVSGKDAALVRPVPKADFKYVRLLDSFPIVGCQFTDLSTHSIPLNYLWTFDIYGNSTIRHPYFEFTDTGNMHLGLTVSDVFGCSDKASEWMHIWNEFRLFMPTAFTTNADLLNDKYRPETSSYLKNYSMEVFNVWGGKIFSTSDLKEGWDGTLNGIACPQGVYVCLIKVTTLYGEQKTYRTTVTLLR